MKKLYFVSPYTFFLSELLQYLKHVLKCVISVVPFKIVDVWKYLVLNSFLMTYIATRQLKAGRLLGYVALLAA
jgi:hypothetical protein